MRITRSELLQILHYDPDKKGPWGFTWIAGRRKGFTAGSIGSRKYVRIQIGDTVYSGHNLAFLYMTGKWPSKNIDHKDRNGHNNKWSNLRLASVSQNGANRRVNKTTKSKLKGVHWSARKSVWQSQIKINGKSIWLGYFNSKQLASKAYEQKARELFGEFAGGAK